jgi:hypothetical protein
MELAEGRVVKVGNQLHVAHGEDKDLYVEFSTEAVHQPYESEQQGHPVYRNVPFITVMFPGDRTKTVHRPAKLKADSSSPGDPERFPRQWAAFQAGEEQAQDGQPLEEWPLVTKADVRMLKDMGIKTVESLAAIGEANLTFLGARMYRDKAKLYLDQATGGAAVSKMVQENETMRLELARQKEQMAELSAALAELQRNPKRNAQKD